MTRLHFNVTENSPYIIGDSRQRTRLTRLKTRHDKATRAFTISGTSHSTSPSTTRAQQPTVLLCTIDCTVRTHSPATTPDLSAPLRIIGCPRADSLPAVSPDLHTSPDNRLPRADSLDSSLAGPLRNAGQPAAQDASPAASPVYSAHLQRPTT
jgi:hypothetical protein